MRCRVVVNIKLNTNNIIKAFYYLIFLGAKAPLGLASVTCHGSGVNPKKFQHAISCMFPYSLVRYHLLGVWRVSGECLEDVWKVGRCLEGVWKVSGECLKGTWKVLVRCQEDVWKISGRCLEDIQKVSGGNLEFASLM